MRKLIEIFVEQVIVHSDYTDMDKTYLVNRVLALVGEEADRETTSTDLITLKEELVALAVDNGLCGSLFEERLFGCRVDELYHATAEPG